MLTESAVAVADALGAMLLVPHEKNNQMVPFVKSFSEDIPEPVFSQRFYELCFEDFLHVTENLERRDNRVPADWHANETLKMTCWPVILAGKPSALLLVCHAVNDPDLTAVQQNLLECLTPLMGSLFENFRLTNEIIHKNSRLSALYDISQQTESLIDLRNIYDAIGKVARSFISFDSYVIYFPSDDGEWLEAKTDKDSISFPTRVKMGEGAVGLSGQELKPYLTYTDEFNSVLILPIEVSGVLKGVLAIGSKKSYAYRNEDIIGLRIIATQIASIDVMFNNILNLKGVTERILENMNYSVMTFDNDGTLTYANLAAKIFWTRKFPEGWNLFKAEDPLPEEIHSLIADVLNTGITIEHQKLSLRIKGQKTVLIANVFPILDEQRTKMGVSCFIRDVTKATAMEEQLLRADKLAALGVLAAGIAHEIRNPLTGMKIIVQLLEGEFGEDDPKYESFSIIEKEIDRLEGIIGNLLDFAKPGKFRSVTVSPISLIEDCHKLINNQILKQNIEFTLEQRYENPYVTGDPDQLKQVFLNIMTNAVQSQPDGGSLIVVVEKTDNSENKEIVISFKDKGGGIPNEKLSDIFNPFMTTKEYGTGLGLSMAQRIIEEHKGKIEVSSVVGEGSVFSVTLPEKSS